MNIKVLKSMPVLAASAALAFGMVTPAFAAQVSPNALHYGPTTQYPSSGGTWEYGFWDAKVRSYYTVGKCHGSSLILNGSTVRSVDTAAGQKSIADKYAIQSPGADDSYYYRTC